MHHQAKKDCVPHPTPESDSDNPRDHRLAEIIESVVTRWKRGELADIAEIVSAHSELQPELGQRLQRLWRAMRLDMPTPHEISRFGMDEQEDRENLTRLIHGYRDFAILNKGAQCAVFSAVRERDGQQIAIKITREGPFGDPTTKARFRREAQILSRLRHPNLVPVHDFGTVQGHFYSVMDLVDGQHLDFHILARRPSVSETLKLFVKICDALSLAHADGVVHRDLKPANILVTADGEPHILDFGLAKEARPGEHSSITDPGRFLGSLPWAAPEQARGEPHMIDSRTDVYAIGVLLYETLTGKPPYPNSGNLLETIRHITDTEPKRPSAFARRLNEEIDSIILKCLQKKQIDRYGSAKDLRDELDRYLDGKPILAKLPSTAYYARKLIARHRVQTALLAVVCLLLLYLPLQEYWLRQKEERARKDARSSAYAASLSAASGGLLVDDVTMAERHVIGAPREHRGWEWQYHLARLDDSLSRHDCRAGRVRGIAFSSDCRTVLIAPESASPILWNPNALGTEAPMTYDVEHAKAVTLRADGSWIVLGSSGRTLYGLNAASGVAQNILTLPDKMSFTDIQCGPDKSNVILTGTAGFRVVNVHNNQVIQKMDLPEQRPGVSCVALSPDRSQLAIGFQDGQLKLLDALSGELRIVQKLHEDVIETICYSTKGDFLTTGSRDTTVRLWAAPSGEPLAVLRGHLDQVRRVSISPDGSRLASAGWDGTIHLWDIGSRSSITVLRGHKSSVEALVFSSDGALLASGDADGSVRLWDARLSSDPFVLRGHKGYVYGLGISADGRWLVSGGWDGFDHGLAAIRFWDSTSGDPICAIDHLGAFATAIACHPSKPRAAVISANALGTDATLFLIDFDTTKVIRVAELHGWPECVSFDPRRNRIAAASGNHVIKVWELSQQGISVVFETLGDCASYDPRGDYLATANNDASGKLAVWEAATFSKHLDPSNAKGAVCSIAWSPDSRFIATARNDHTVQVVDSTDGHLHGVLKGHSGGVMCVAFSPDGRRLASGGYDRVVRIWDTSTLEEVAQLHGHHGYIYRLAFTPDGKTLFTASGDKTIRMWNDRPLKDVLQARRDRASSLSNARDLLERPFRNIQARDDTNQVWGSVLAGNAVPHTPLQGS